MKKIVVRWPALPVNCGECPLFKEDSEAILTNACPVTNEKVGRCVGGSKRHELCPLKLKEK